MIKPPWMSEEQWERYVREFRLQLECTWPGGTPKLVTPAQARELQRMVYGS